MHMIHTRRKAEIEILSSVSRTADEDDHSLANASDNLLLQYLVTKIAESVAALDDDADSDNMDW